MPLQVEIGGNTSGFEQAMAKAQALASVAASQIKDKFTDASEKIATNWAVTAAKFAAVPVLVGVGGTIATFALMSKAIDLAIDKMEELIKIGERASSVGIGTNFLQAWEGGARKAGLSIEEMTASLKKALDVSKDVLGGSALSGFLTSHTEAGNITKDQATSVTGATSQEARLKASLDLIQQMLNAGKELAAFDLAGKVFGDKFEGALRKNTDLIITMKAELDKPSKGIFSEEEIGRAENINKRLAEAKDKLSTEFTPVAEFLAHLGVNYLSTWTSIVEAIAAAVGWANKLATAASNSDSGFQKFFGRVNKFLEDKGVIDDSVVKKVTEQDIGVDALRRGLQNQAALNAAKNESLAMVRAVIPDKSKPLDVKPEKEKPAKAATTESLDQVERFISNLQKQNDLLRVEAENFGKSNAEREKSVGLVKLEAAARLAQRSATEAETKAVEEQSLKRAKLLDQMEKQQDLVQLQKFAGNQLIDVLDKVAQGGAKASDLILQMGNAIRRAAIQALVLGEGPLAFLFGTKGQGGATGGLIGLLANAFKTTPGTNAAGTPNWRGGLTWVGEDGPELVNVPKGSQIYPNGAGPGGGVVVSINQPIDARGAQSGVAEQIAAALEMNNRNMRVQLPAMIRDARLRNTGI